MLEDVPDARSALSQIEKALDAHGVKRAVFDQREVGEHADSVREAMWQWAQRSRSVEAIAIMAGTEMAQVRANMTALSRHVKLRAFTDPEEAQRWVRTTIPGHASGFYPKMS
jgi:hypothetical protein